MPVPLYYCYLCDKEITDTNRTREHIIPGALGSNVTSTCILCGPCNNGLASQIDTGLISFYTYLYGLLQEARPNTNAKNRVVGQTRSGEKIAFSAGMKADVKVVIELPDKSRIELTGPETHIKKKVLQRLRQLKGKFPRIDPEKWLAAARWEERHIEELVYFSNHDTFHSIAGGPEFFRGIKKIALNFYLSKGYDRQFIRGVIYQVKHALPANHVISTFYYPTIRPVHILGECEVSHIIKLVGDPEMQVLYCYVELFNCNHALVILNNHYDGPAINDQLCYDVLTSIYIEKDINLPFKHRAHVIDLCKVDRDTNPHGEAAYRRTRQILEEAIRAKGHII